MRQWNSRLIRVVTYNSHKMTRVYLLVKFDKEIYKKSQNYLVIEAYSDKHKAEKKVEELNSDKKKNHWYGFVKFDIVDLEPSVT